MIFISQEDFRRLRSLAAAAASAKPGAASPSATLRDELERATIMGRDQLPPGVVTVNSRVRFRDVATGEVEEYVVTWPDRADGGIERISVLAPIGTALLGFREGDEVTWPTPGGMRRLQILEVAPVSEEALADPDENPIDRFLNRPR